MTGQLSRAEFLKLTSARRASYAFKQGVRWGFDGSLIGMPITAAAIAMAPRGDKLAAGAGTATSLLTFPIFQGATAAAISLIPGVGPTAALFVSMFAAAFPASATENLVSRAVRTFSRAGRQVRSLETGQNFQDNEFQAARRTSAMNEMAAIMQPSRRYLGQEARFMHR